MKVKATHPAIFRPSLASQITTFTEAQLEAGQVYFVHDGSATTEATFTVTVSDGIAISASATIIVSVPTVTIDVLTAERRGFRE